MQTNEKSKNIGSKNEWFFESLIENMSLQHGHKLNKQGFSFVELIVVMAIVVILATIALPVFNDAKNKTKTSKCMANIEVLDKKIVMYMVDKGQPPADLTPLALAPNEIIDPWGKNYVYYNIRINGTGGAYTDYTGGKSLNTEYDLYSVGPDGGTEKDLSKIAGPSMDDIVRGHDGSKISIASIYFP